MLQQLGYQITACGSANEALTCFIADPNGFDLVLSDMTMPRTSGVELLRRVREHRPEIPVILMTGFAGLLNEAELKRYGINEFIIKPLSAQEIGTTIRRCLTPDDQPQPDQPQPTAPPKVDSSPSTKTAVLVIDDDQMVRNAMTQLLSSMGYKPVAASSINEASEQLDKHEFTAVLVDHHLKEEDGFAAVDQLREQASINGKPPRFIGMTGSGASENTGEHALDGYLVKPFSAEQLQAFLQ